MRAGWVAALSGAIAVAVLLSWPGPIESRHFDPGPPPALVGALAPNRILTHCRPIGEVSHADKLLVDERGRVYAGDDRGEIQRFDPDGSGGFERTTLARPGGRLMEIDRSPGGELVIADLHGAHAVVDSHGGSTRLDTLAGLPHGTAGVAVGRDGVLYYGAHTERYAEDEQVDVFLNMLAARPTSELRAFDPRTGRERILADGLLLPVGVELSAAEDYVAVAEFFAYRVTRHWLTGPKAGTTDRLIENLPGFVDGLASDGEGRFYLSLPGLRPPAVDWLHRHPFVKDQLAKLLPLLLRLGGAPNPSLGLVLELDEAGQILRSFHDPDGTAVRSVTAAEIHEGHLYLTSITGGWIARCPLEERPPNPAR